jgi:aminopeptidase N
LFVLLAGTAAAQGISEDTDRQLRAPFNDPRVERHWPRSRGYDLQHVKVELNIDWEKRAVAGVSTLTLAPLNDGLTHLQVDAAEMKIETVALAPPSAGQAGGQALDFAHQGDKLTIVLNRAYEADEQFTVAIRYWARPRKGLYFRGPDDAYPDKPLQVWSQGETQYTRHWIPVYDFPNDKTTSEMIVTVPQEMVVISNGTLLDVREGGSRKTFHWKESVPHSTYLISLVAGRFQHYRDNAGDIPLDYYVPVGTDRATAERSFAATVPMVDYFSEWIGIPYPYEKYAQTTVDDFLWGGMENVSASTLYTDTLHDEAAAPNWTSEGLVAHELVHQWWGDLLTCKDWSHIWLNESFATFFTNLWYEHRYGRDEYDYRRWRDANRYFCEDRGDFRPDCDDHRDHYRRPIVWSTYVDEHDLFDRHAYPKGGLVLAMLRGLLGDDLFQKALRHYGRKHARQAVDTEDLREAIAEVTGKELGWFFEQWLYRSGHPELQVEYEWDEDTRTAHLTMEQQQELKELTPVFRVPAEVEFLTASGPQRFRITLTGKRGEFSFPLPERPTHVRFDPDQHLLKRLSFPMAQQELIDILREDLNVQGRLWAAEQLAAPGSNPAGLEALRAALLEDPFYGVRAEVAYYLGQTKSPAARDALLEAAEDSDPRVRQNVMKALGEFSRDVTAAAALRKAVTNDEKTYVVAEALRSLGRIRAEGAFESLLAALERDSHREIIRRKALSGLAKLNDPRALPLLMEWSRYGRAPKAREAAIELLASTGRGNEETFQHLLALLNDPYIWARRSALRALGDLGDSRALPSLQAYAANEPERRLQREAERAMERIRVQPATEASRPRNN